MCESFEKLADKRAKASVEKNTVEIVKAMMKNLKLPLEKALDAADIKGKERAIIAKQLA